MGKPKHLKETPTFYGAKGERALQSFMKCHFITSKSKAQAKIVRDALVNQGHISRDDAERFIR